MTTLYCYAIENYSGMNLDVIFKILVEQTFEYSNWLSQHNIEHHISMFDASEFVLKIQFDNDADAMMFRLRYSDRIINLR